MDSVPPGMPAEVPSPAVASTWIAHLTSAIFVAGTVGPYIPQYLSIARTGNASGFSTAVSGILIISNIIRIFFYFAAPFEATLLAQSVAAVVSQTALLQLCVRLNAANNPSTEKTTDIWTAPIRSLWSWTNFDSYLVALAGLVATLICGHAVAGQNANYAQSLGALALGIESLLGVPQAVKNAQAGSVRGLSPALIGSWLLGDSFKAYYFGSTGAPWQFLACAGIQVCTDCFILWQIFVKYASSRVGGSKRKASIAVDESPILGA